MLQHLSTLTPRGVYVCGNTTSNAGLTVSLHKDPISGDYALEAGALVLGDQGCCCIDEFDKMAVSDGAVFRSKDTILMVEFLPLSFLFFLESASGAA